MFKALKIVVLVLFLQPQVSNSVVWLLYEFNKAAITEAFCVNKDKPALKCNGKCHLATQLTEPQPIGGTQPTEATYIPQIQLFFIEVDQPTQVQENTFHRRSDVFQNYSFTLINDLDRPPRA